MTPGPRTEPSTASAKAAPQLLRALGPMAAIAMVIGSTIGSGIFAKPGVIAGAMGSFPLIIGIWIGAGLLCLCGALCFSELAAMLPQSGGLYVYLREAWGKLAAFLFGWCEFWFARPASNGALAVMFAGSLCRAMGLPTSPVSDVALASVVIAAVALINIVGVAWGGWVQIIVTSIKVIFVSLIIVVPFAMFFHDGQGIVWSNYSTTYTPANSNLSMQISAVMLAVMWAYNGWHQLTPVAEEVRNPQRNIPLAMIGGLGVLIVLYVGANIAYYGVLPMPALAQAGKHGAEEVLRVIAGPVGALAMSGVIMISVFGTLACDLLHGPRVIFAMGRDNLFFPGLGRVHQKFRTPAFAIIVQAGMSILLVVSSALLIVFTQHFNSRSIFDILTDYVVFSLSLFYTLGVAAVFILRAKRPLLERPYRTWGYPVTPALFLAGYVWFLTRIYFDMPVEANIGVGLIATGIPFFYAWKFWLAKRFGIETVAAGEPPAAIAEPGS